jgi:hypothetical protein
MCFFVLFFINIHGYLANYISVRYLCKNVRLSRTTDAPLPSCIASSHARTIFGEHVSNGYSGRVPYIYLDELFIDCNVAKFRIYKRLVQKNHLSSYYNEEIWHIDKTLCKLYLKKNITKENKHKINICSYKNINLTV